MAGNDWYDDPSEGDSDDLQVDEYDITASPNDFNVLTINHFITSGAVRIPGFQRNYVWDIGRASKLIESLILGLPVPQIFLYEMTKNQFLVIDGQQRLMSIYYFMKGRFPKKEKRSELRVIFDETGDIPEHVLHDDDYFDNFRLKLPEVAPQRPNRFKGLGFQTLAEHKQQFELRTIRNVIIKQNAPNNDDSSMFEVFNRLNTGSVNLRPQEIRTSMYHSRFYDMLYKLNTNPGWRRLLGEPAPDLHMKDIEILLRAYALLIDRANYAPSMVKFLNRFSRKMRDNQAGIDDWYQEVMVSFINACAGLPEDTFIRNGRFNVALFEATFVGVASRPFANGSLVEQDVDADRVQRLEDDGQFGAAIREGTTKTENVQTRLRRAIDIMQAA